MTFIQALILGIIQGLTEFFPISSSAHLTLARRVLAIPYSETFLYFDLLCHAGTLLALCIYLRSEIWKAFKSIQTIGLLSLALFPLVPAYFLLKPLRTAASDPAYLGYFLLITSFLLFMASILGVMQESEYGEEVALNLSQAEPASKQLNLKSLAMQMGLKFSGYRRNQSRFLHHEQYEDQVPCGEFRRKWKSVLCIGCMQTLALLPGISRSGSTIATARLLGWNWVSAAKFSFLLSIPTILGGQLLETMKLWKEPSLALSLPLSCYAVGFAASFAVGLIGVRFVFWIYELGKVRPFAWYCLGAAIVAWLTSHG